MGTTITDLLCNQFGGIRRKNARFDAEKITCSDCQNVELYDTKINSGVGIRTVKGNVDSGFPVSTGEEIIGIFETVQASGRHFIVYVEDATAGALYEFNISAGTRTLLKGSLAKTGKCCGTDFERGSNEQTADVFVFTNGTNVLEVLIGSSTTVTGINVPGEAPPQCPYNYGYDADNKLIKGLGCKVYDNRIWLFHDNKLIYSTQGEERNFNTHSADNNTSAGVIDFTKPITAIMPYLDSLAIFFEDSSCLLSGSYPYQKTDESPGGCASYEALVFHGTELWFYDDTKKGIYSFRQVVTGDKTLGENVAIDIQEELLSIDKTKLDKIKALSIVLDDRNEIWFILPTHYTQKTTIMIFDYSHGEWMKRVCQHINCFGIVNDVLYSGGAKVYKEYESQTFDGTYIENRYDCSILNFGIDNALKVFYFPPRITLDMIGYSNKFYVKYIRNYDYTKNKKEKFINAKGLKKILHFNVGEKYNEGYVYPPKKYSTIAKLPSSTFKTLQIQIYTKDEKYGADENYDGDYGDFAINNFECTKVKIKQI